MKGRCDGTTSVQSHLLAQTLAFIQADRETVILAFEYLRISDLGQFFHKIPPLSFMNSDLGVYFFQTTSTTLMKV